MTHWAPPSSTLVLLNSVSLHKAKGSAHLFVPLSSLQPCRLVATGEATVIPGTLWYWILSCERLFFCHVQLFLNVLSVLELSTARCSCLLCSKVPSPDSLIYFQHYYHHSVLEHLAFRITTATCLSFVGLHSWDIVGVCAESEVHSHCWGGTGLSLWAVSLGLPPGKLSIESDTLLKSWDGFWTWSTHGGLYPVAGQCCLVTCVRNECLLSWTLPNI